MMRHAVLISCEEYEAFSPTPHAHADNQLLFDTLTQQCDYAEQHVLSLKLNKDSRLTPVEILAQIKELVSGSNPGDSILFYFAGHGHFFNEATYLILPATVPGAYERTALAIGDISNELRIPDKCCFRILDACHSGLDVRDDSAVLNSKDFLRAFTHDPSGWITLASCKEDEYSVSDPDIGHGIFTYYLCKYIGELDVGKPVIPELLKVDIADKVAEHAKKLRSVQTPTLNASISGNISLAVRRIDSSKKGESVPANDLAQEIGTIKGVRSIVDETELKRTFTVLAEEVIKGLGVRGSIKCELSIGKPIMAETIPEKMRPAIISIVNRGGHNPRHLIRKTVEEVEDPYNILAPYFMRTKRKIVEYEVRQASRYPSTAQIVTLNGDDRCIPDSDVLVYLIPLQLTALILIAGFIHKWPPDEEDLELISYTIKNLKPEDGAGAITEVVPRAVSHFYMKLEEAVRNRVAQLKKELASGN